MLRPESSFESAGAAIAREFDRIALPVKVDAPAAGDAQRGFRSLYREIHAGISAEISRFIAEGAGSRSAAGLSVEGGALRARLQTAAPASQVDAAQSADAGASRAQQEAFVASIAPYAREAAERLGVAPHLVAAHAALESGWGQQPVRDSNGNSTNNLFGVKAAAGWSGPSALALTTEYTAGAPLIAEQAFRSYGEPAEAFRDYARLLRENPRYRGVLGVGADASAFAKALAAGSYATDPHYAQKLERVARQLRELDTPLNSSPQGTY